MQFSGMLFYLLYHHSIEKVKDFPTSYIQTLFSNEDLFYLTSASP